jgi:ketosteroid isomerase-like protein
MEQFFACFGCGDIAGCVALMGDDVEVHEPTGLPYGGEYRGPAGFGQLIEAIMADYVLTLDGVRLIDGDDRVVALLDVTFEHQVTGKRSDMRAVEVYTVEAGRISDIDVYYWNPQTLHDLAVATV